MDEDLSISKNESQKIELDKILVDRKKSDGEY